MSKQYKVHTKYIFKGTYYVNADNKKDAEDMVKNFCGTTIGNIHTVLDDEDVTDWAFDVHPIETKTKVSI